MNYRLHELDDMQFETLVGAICSKVLGTGTIVFAQGRDGGRDGKFEGTANNFPSKKVPATGKFIVQAKHTTSPVASCSDNDFEKIVDKEIPKIDRLVKSNELDLYVLFTNRRLPGGKHQPLIDKIENVKGVKKAYLIGRETIEILLEQNPEVWIACGYSKFDNPLRIFSSDICETITEFRKSFSTTKINGEEANLAYPGIKNKNVINKLSAEYYSFIIESSMQHFKDVDDFLENPRNFDYLEQYQSTAEEIRAKLLSKRNQFVTFDDVFNHLYDIIIDGNKNLKSKRLVRVFLHHMYCMCDIGEKHVKTQ